MTKVLSSHDALLQCVIGRFPAGSPLVHSSDFCSGSTDACWDHMELLVLPVCVRFCASRANAFVDGSSVLSATHAEAHLDE